VAGHSNGFSANVKYDPQTAKALLDRFGYKDRDGDGYRETPDASRWCCRWEAPRRVAIASATSSG